MELKAIFIKLIKLSKEIPYDKIKENQINKNLIYERIKSQLDGLNIEIKNYNIEKNISLNDNGSFYGVYSVVFKIVLDEYIDNSAINKILSFSLGNSINENILAAVVSDTYENAKYAIKESKIDYNLDNTKVLINELYKDLFNEITVIEGKTFSKLIISENVLQNLHTYLVDIIK